MTLTREQVLAMGAGEQMDRLIALNIMGFEPSNMRDGWIRMGALATYPKQYSTDISAAWEVVEKLAKSGLGVEMYVNRVTNTVIMGQIMVHCDDSMPLAISRAALITTIGEGTE